jgi:hypothetical protein
MTTNINKRLDSYINGMTRRLKKWSILNDLIISYEDIEVENIHNKKFIKHLTENVVEVLMRR